MPFLKHKQQAAARFASSFAPKTAAGIAVRNTVTRFLRLAPVADLFIGRAVRDTLVLPDYGF